MSRCLNPQTSPEVRLLRVSKTYSPGMTGGFWKTIMFIRVWCSLVFCAVFAVSGLVFRFFYISRLLKFHTINWRISPTRTTTWMSQEVCKRLGSVGYTSNFSHLEAGEITHFIYYIYPIPGHPSMLPSLCLSQFFHHLPPSLSRKMARFFAVR